MRDRVVQARVGRLATVTGDGAPHVVPCCFVLEADTIYSAVDAKPKSTLALRRLDNIRANPLASLVVDHYSDDWNELWWVRVDGAARIVIESSGEHRAALAALTEKYRQYVAIPPPGSVVAIDITGWRGWP